MPKVIQTHIFNSRRMNDDYVGLHLEDLERFLGLKLARGMLDEKTHLSNNFQVRNSDILVLETQWLVSSTRRL